MFPEISKKKSRIPGNIQVNYQNLKTAISYHLWCSVIQHIHTVHTHTHTHLTPRTHLTPWRHTTRSKPLPRLALCSDSRRKKRFNHGSKLVWWKNDSSGHNVHVRAISTHYAVIWKVMELKPAWGTELPRAPSAGPRERLHMLSDNTLPWQHWGGWRHELWVNLIGWLCSQTSLRAMKRGVCCTKLRWINVYTCTYHTHTHTLMPASVVFVSSCDMLSVIQAFVVGGQNVCVYRMTYTTEPKVCGHLIIPLICDTDRTCDCNSMGINVLRQQPLQAFHHILEHQGLQIKRQNTKTQKWFLIWHHNRRDDICAFQNLYKSLLKNKSVLWCDNATVKVWLGLGKDRGLG